jgi:hypothetical protein
MSDEHIEINGPYLVAALLREVQELGKSVSTNTERSNNLAKTVRWGSIKTRILAISVIVDLALSGLFVYQHIQQTHTNHRIQCVVSYRNSSVQLYAGDVEAIKTLLVNAANGKLKTKRSINAAVKSFEDHLNADQAQRKMLNKQKVC